MTKLITERVRDFRKDQTPSENILWQLLRNRKIGGYKFYRQHIRFNFFTMVDMEVQGAATIFAVNMKRIITLIAQK